MSLTETLLASLPIYGLPLLAGVIFISCLGAPLPGSIVMMLMGAFAAAGDFTLWAVVAVALGAAVGGDQIGYLIGQTGGRRLVEWLAANPARKTALDRAEQQMAARGAAAVFLTRWLLSPLGPYLNLLAGAARFSWLRFTLAGIAGEGVWVGVYTGLGATFSDNVTQIAEISGNVSGLIVTGGLAVYLGLKIVTILRRSR
ncbi:DedA family protein [Rhizobium sp. AAP43]|uniref:DedA family protein n=1 Tax=Rhizobium sp. AAP43 TaxID=1523420 RepID=UPI0006B95185|nr:VTT domain-containing protein [Rhizobium sp. AAP43]